MKPVIAIVGRPNVGKSTLFNCLTRTRAALVAEFAGLTRDRQYGRGVVGDKPYIIVDTGGLSGNAEGVDAVMAQQVQQALDESHAVLFVVDGAEGLSAADQQIASALRRTQKIIHLVINKTDGRDPDIAASDFYRLGFTTVFCIAASHGRGIDEMMVEVLKPYPVLDETEEAELGIKAAIIGRPNVGKSTLVNRLLGEERVIAFDQPGTTRDSIHVPFQYGDQRFTLIDTAGIRRRARVSEVIEKFSVIKALQAIGDAHVVLMVIDASEGITDQDLTLLGEVLNQGRAIILVINKWDGLDADHKERVKSELARKLNFIDYAEYHFISALHGSGVGLLPEAIIKAYNSAMRQMPTPLLTDLLQSAVFTHQPPLVRGRRVKLRYAHQGGKNPPVIVIHGSQAEHLPNAYIRYLERFFRTQLKLFGTPVQIQLKTGKNPYKDKANVLSERQQLRRKRLISHIKKSDKKRRNKD
ncbi:MAG: ribosome biogenesis GTPase Der [Gammaproteobacteria bacterium]|nr:ribosome biogenesis GTPase Der [Gammaproteobacteria bacterium]